MTTPESQSEILRRHRQARLQGLLTRIGQELPDLAINEPAAESMQPCAVLTTPSGAVIPLTLDADLPDVFFALGPPSDQPPREAYGKLGEDQVLDALRGHLAR